MTTESITSLQEMIRTLEEALRVARSRLNRARIAAQPLPAHPYADTVMQVYLAQRLAHSRSGVIMGESNGWLVIERNGQFAGSVKIVDGCVKYLDVIALLARAS